VLLPIFVKILLIKEEEKLQFDSIHKRSEENKKPQNLSHFAQQMISQEQHHLQMAEEIEEEIRRIQNSTKVLWPIFSSAHNYMRMRFKWYYLWHINRNCYQLHIAAFLLILLAVGFVIFDKLYEII